MNVLLPVVGVRGDVQIFLALAGALEARGHKATVLLGKRFQPLAEYMGIKSIALAGDDDAGAKELQAIMRAKSTLDKAKTGIGFFFDAIREHTQTLQTLVPGYDVIVGYGQFAQAEADAAGKPFVSVVIDPAMAEKRYTWNIGKNLALAMERFALHTLMGKEYAQFRKEHGFPSAKDSDNPRRILLPMSAHVVTPDTNWTERNVLAGYWYAATPDTFSPPKALASFLEEGEPPIFITFGSAGRTEEDESALRITLFRAVEQARVRAVILTKGEVDLDTPSDVYLVRDVPYAWLLPRVACVVHHCGMGTTAEVLRAGIPSVPVPYMLDQFTWAKRIFGLGLATEALPRTALTADALATRIRACVDDKAFRERAVALATAIADEQGLKTAVDAIESLFTEG